MNAYTEGPWKVRGEYSVWIDAKASHHGICGVTGAGTSDNGLANARLIAEAPEMLEVLEQLIDQSQGCTCPNNGGGDCDWCQAVDHARLVIEAAKGEGAKP